MRKTIKTNNAVIFLKWAAIALLIATLGWLAERYWR